MTKLLFIIEQKDHYKSNINTVFNTYNNLKLPRKKNYVGNYLKCFHDCNDQQYIQLQTTVYHEFDFAEATNSQCY